MLFENVGKNISIFKGGLLSAPKAPYPLEPPVKKDVGAVGVLSLEPPQGDYYRRRRRLIPLNPL